MNEPTRVVLLGYASYVLVTWILLCLPFSWQAEPIGPLDNLFIATSAISTTGLITVNTPDAYSFLGELVIALAFQVGGLGYMTLGSFVILAREESLSSRRQQVGETVFSLPDRFDLKTFLRHTIIFTVLVEIAGFIGLYIAFSSAGVPNAVWAAIFHSISAFCTAGFSVFPNSLMDFEGNLLVNVVVTILSLLGSIGFIVVSDVWLSTTRPGRRLSLTTKIILYATFSFVIVGWLFLLFFEPSMVPLPFFERIMSSWFQAMTALTTVGFNTHAIENLAAAPVFVMLILMVIGASPSGTGGGLKTTSISTALAVVWAALRGREDAAFLGKRLPTERVLGAFAAFAFYLIMFLAGTILVLLVQGQAFEDVVFETASALGTVGLSRGITGDLVPFGKIVVILLMFIGRVGPITFGLALFSQDKKNVRLAEEDIAI
jgi:trk system potassium uptake protein TrkH